MVDVLHQGGAWKTSNEQEQLSACSWFVAWGCVPAAYTSSGAACVNDSANKPKLFGGERELVKSVGATARLNLFGFAVLQVDYSKPLDRPGRKAFFQFNLLSGF